ncbi:MAG: type 4a pilus biogenesis protein PilO [Candidatus Competibacterales bacterium]|nr:type 4a pilus biogenesis protein PilO [Candidatus Competibacterales bacterium]
MTLSDLNDLDFNNFGAWPLPARIGLIIIIIAAVGAAGYYFHVKDQIAELERVRQQETSLRSEFEEKQKVVANLDAYRARIEELRGMLAELVKQLPTRTEMPDLLEEVSNLGRSNGLQFRLFRPAGERRQEFFVNVPIQIQATASYHQFGEFVSSIAAMERIVTLEQASLGLADNRIEPGSKPLNVSATLQTYRYVEEGEDG